MTDALTQYLALVGEHRATLDAHAPAVLNNLRDDAIKTLTNTSLPHFDKKIGYVFTSLNDLFTPDYGLNITRRPFSGDIADALRLSIPTVSAAPLIVANDYVDTTQPIFSRLQPGLTICTFAQAAKSCPEFLARHLNKHIPSGAREVDINTLLAQDGILIHIERGVTVSRPVQIINLLSATMPLMAVRRLLVVLDQGATLKLITTDFTHPDCKPSMTSTVSEFALAQDASLTLYDIEEANESTTRVSSLGASLEDNAHMEVFPITLSCGHTRNNYTINLNAPGATLNIAACAITSGKSVADSSATVNHNAPRCHSNQVFKNALDDDSRAAFEGLIRVCTNADHTEAYQANRNVVVSDKARVHTAPQLEIYCDDVKCSHGAATGRLDEQALFYMQSRGIPLAEARTMLMQAFMADIIDRIEPDSLRNPLRRLIEHRLSHGTIAGIAEADALCNQCGAC